MLLYTFLLTCLLPAIFAATADQWRGRSIYQLVTDRFALPSGYSGSTDCDPAKETWCGGNWQAIIENLDYIQDAGFTAIWISPVAANYDGPTTPYGDAYHGYWVSDISQLNPHFGTSDDLKNLSAELHRRGMYLMVDVVINNVMSTSLNATTNSADLSTYYFQDPSQYHPYCVVDYSNLTSEELCWLGDTVVPLPDLKTENPTVVEGYATWIQQFVSEYNVDGLRIDAAKHVNVTFWPQFSEKAGVYCIGEVMESDVQIPAMFQGALDGILNYPTYYALVDAFVIPGTLNMTALADIFNQSKAIFPDTTLLGNFLEDQDIPRWHNLSVDPQSLYNAMVWNYMSDGIPINYYGQEQYFNGSGDPYNREALWPSGYQRTAAYNLTVTLNTFRNFLVNSTDWATQKADLLSYSNTGIAIMKGNVVSVMTNIGSPPANVSNAVYTPWTPETAVTEILTCTPWVTGSNGTIEVQYTAGGVPAIFIPSANLVGSGFCGYEVTNGIADTSFSIAHAHRPSTTAVSLSLLFSCVLAFAFVL